MGFFSRHKRRFRAIFGHDSTHGGVPPASSSPFVTINDEVYATDAPGQIEVPNFQCNVIEGNRTLIKLIRTLGVQGPLSVDWETRRLGHAAPGVDYVESSGVLTWADGDVSERTIEVETIANLGVDEPRLFEVRIVGSASPRTRVVGGRVQVSIIDDDSAGIGPSAFRFSQITAKVVESGGAITLKVNRSGSTTGAVGCSFATANGTALAGTHYTNTSGTLSWADGEGGEKSFTVPIINVGGAGGNKTFTATISAPTGAAGIDAGYATVSVEIIDDESFTVTPGTLGFGGAALAASEAVGTLAIAVHRTGGSTGNVSVDYTAVELTAIEGENFLPCSGTLTWLNGDSTVKYIPLTIINDSQVSQPVSLTVTLSGVTGGAALGTSVVTVTINEDDRVSDFIDGNISCISELIAASDEVQAISRGILYRPLGLVVGSQVGPPVASETNRGATDTYTGTGTSNNFGMQATPTGKNTLQSV